MKRRNCARNPILSDYKISFNYGETPVSQGSEGSETAIIEFLCAPELEGKIPHPQKSIRAAPQWFKSLEREMDLPMQDGLPGLTAKACLPMTDAFSLGFMLPLTLDVHLRIPEDRVSIQMGYDQEAPFVPIEQHHPGQLGAPNPPFHAAMPLKFINPWRIKVPEGYSVLIAPPLSRPDLPFTPFSGLVDCDRFDTTINIPFLWNGPVGDFTLPAGLPIAQLIPIRRDTLIKESVARASTPEELDAQKLAATRKYGEESTYAREWRVKK